MTDRVVSYLFRGNFSSLTAGLAASGRGVQDLGTKLTALDRNGVKMRRGLDQIGGSAGRLGLVAAAGLGAAVAAAANFDAAMSKVAATGDDAKNSLDDLRQAAISAGARTVFSASEAAGAVENLAKAGVSAKDILGGGLNGALDLAAAGGLEVADAAEVAATAMTQFKLSGEQIPHLADLLAAGASKAQGDVTDLSYALKQSGLVASQMGISVEETTGALAAFASAGLLGSDAGTSFRQLLLSLANPTAKSAKLMDTLGISAYDAGGQFIGLTKLSGNLQQALADKTQEERTSALATIFGSDAIRAASILYDQGAEGIANWTNKVNDAGFASETAATRLDNLKGDLEQLRGALETALIGAGDGSQGPLRGLTQGATDAVNAFNKLPGPIQNTAVALLAITAVTGGALWFGSKVIGGIVNTREALSNLGVDAGKTRGILAGLGKGFAIAGALTAIAQLQQAIQGEGIKQSDLQRNLEALANGAAVKDFANLSDSISHANSGFDDFIEVGAEASTVFGLFGQDTQLDRSQKEIEKVDQALANMVESGNAEQAAAAFKAIADAAKADTGTSVGDTTKLFDSYATAIKNAASGAGGATGPTNAYGSAIEGTGSAADAAAEDLSKLIKSMRDQREAALSGFDAETQYREALKAAREQADKSSAGIKGNSDEALKNRDVISGLASAWNDQSDAVKNNEKRFREARGAFIETATAMGVPIGQARRLARSLLEIPESRVTTVTANTSQAAGAIARIRESLASLKDKNVNVRVSTLKQATNGGLERAEGGPIYGPGTATSDSIPAMLSNGEYVIRAAAVARYGLGFFSQANNMRLAKGGAPGRLRGDVTDIRNYLTDELGLRWPKTLKQWEKALDKSKDALDKERSARDAVVSKMESTSSAIQGTLRSDLFGKTPDVGNIWQSATERAASKAGTGVRSTLISDIGNIQAFNVAIAQLKSKGLDGAALDELLSRGSLTEVQSFASQSKSQLADYEKLFNTRSVLLASTGAAGATAAYGKELVAQTAEVKKVAAFTLQLNREVVALTKELKNQPDKNGKAVGKAINGAAPRKRP